MAPFASAATADVYTGIGGGVLYTDGAAFQIAVPLYRGLEGHYSLWRHGGRDRAAGIGYRFRGRKSISAVIGVAYIGALTDNLLHRADAYLEVRIGPFDNFSCQISHYSSVGDDKGENLLLCGVQWDWFGGG